MEEWMGKTVAELDNYTTYVQLAYGLQKRMGSSLKKSGPKQKLIATYGDNNSSIASSQHMDAITELSMLTEQSNQYSVLIEKIERIENALASMCDDECRVLVMRHIHGWSMTSITEELGYSSRQSAYNIYKRAVKNFSKLLPNL